MKTRIWVIEMRQWCDSKWGPTVGCYLTREEAREQLCGWKQRNPEYYFRVTEYRPASK